MKRVLITGGAGFIGSHLVDLALNSQAEVVVLDNLRTGRLENLAAHRSNPRLHFIHGDILEPETLRSAMNGVHTVFHLAALADIVPSVQNPLDYHRTNVDGTFAVLEAARRADVKRLVYAASSSCYGIPNAYPTAETAPVDPRYPYALTKWVGEQYALHWGAVYGLPVVSLRLFNVYGPRSRTSGTYGAVFGVFLAQKAKGVPYTVVGEGTQTRDFTFVTDVADAFWRAAASPLRGEVINIGSGGTYSINRLVQLLGGPVTHIPKRPGEPDCTFADTGRAQALLQWRARVPFEEGVQRMLAALNDWKDAPLWTPDTIAAATSDWFRYLGPTPMG